MHTCLSHHNIMFPSYENSKQKFSNRSVNNSFFIIIPMIDMPKVLTSMQTLNVYGNIYTHTDLDRWEISITTWNLNMKFVKYHTF